MDRETRIAFLVDHYQRPRNKGALQHPDACIPGGNPGCGDLVTMYVKADPSGQRIEQVSFEGAGCTISQAAASILSERVNREHWTFQDALAFTPERMMDLLGRDIVDSRPGCATLALGTLKAAVKTIETDRALRAAGKSDAEIQRLRQEVAARAAGPGFVLGDAATRLQSVDHEETR